jgi:hypothetical protein
VDGFSATTAPHFPRMARCAIACAPGRIVRTRSFPRIVEPLSLSTVFRKTVSRFAFEPVR